MSVAHDRNDLFDLVVVGGGLAGLVAAVRAAELGLKVCVLEKGDGPEYPCNSRYSGGIIHVAYQSPKLPPHELIESIRGSPQAQVDTELATTLAEGAGPLIDWLGAHGARFVRAGPQEGRAWTLAPVHPFTCGLHWKGRGPDVLLRSLRESLEKSGGVLVLSCRGRALLTDGDRCIGVEAQAGDETRQFFASATLLADGGFQANLDMLGQYIAPVPEGVQQRNAQTATGDGIRMATAIGAALTDMDRFYGHLLARGAFENPLLWPYPQLDAIAVAAIMVDDTGRRFVDEGAGGVYMANIIAGLEKPLSTLVVFDAQIWESPGRSARIPANPQLERAGATIHRADSLEALAALIGVPVESFIATVQKYNEAVRSGTLERLDTPRTSTRYEAMPLAKPPFFAIPACAGITYTMGGIRIDGNARVLRPDGNFIAGLYAAGTTTGGLEGGERVRYVGGLSRAGVFGLRAAEHVARMRGSTL